MLMFISEGAENIVGKGDNVGYQHFFMCLKVSEFAFVVLGFNPALTAKVISWRSVTHEFPGFLTPALTQLFLPKPPTTFLTCFRRGERRKYAGKKSRLNRGSNSQPPGHESVTLTTEPPGRAEFV